jgi:hypothetical protein
MAHPLDGARLKVIRAHEHLDCLKAEVGMYLQEQAHEVRSQPARNPQVPWLSTTHTLRSLVPTVPPLRLSAIIGDCVTNARAALDYIMWELAARYFEPPVDLKRKGEKRITAFPIFKRPGDKCVKDRFDALTNRKIPAPAITEIKRAQPYNAGYEPLLSLQKLVNRDKHQTLLLTTGDFDHMIVELNPVYDQMRKSETITIPRDDLATGNQPAFQSDVEMKGKAAIYVTWKDVSMPREPVDLTLEKIVKSVVDIVPRFDRFFI